VERLVVEDRIAGHVHLWCGDRPPTHRVDAPS